MNSETTFENVCRTCLTSGLLEMCSLLENSYFNDSLGNILLKCCAIEPEINGMPNIICPECKNQLLSFYKFRKQCEESDSVLRTYVKNNISAVYLKDDNSNDNDSEFNDDLDYIDIKEDPIQSDIIEIITDELHCNKKDSKDNKKVRLNTKTTCKTCNLQKCKCNLQENDTHIKIPTGITLKPVSKLKSNQNILEKQTEIISDKTLDTNKELDKSEQSDLLEISIKPSRQFHQCPICYEHFAKKTYLEQHVIKHDSALPFTCKQCGKCFSRYRNLLLHEKLHTGKRPYTCTTCGKSFALSGNLKTHIRIHTGHKPYSCQHCGKTFAQWSSLRSHLVCHTGDRSYICAVCGKSFTRAGILARHMTSHSDEKKYECNICKKRFKNTSQRSRHMVTHTDIKKYKCSYCGKCFNRASNLKVHEMIHSGNRPHSCPVCGKGFIQLHCLRSHMNTHC